MSKPNLRIECFPDEEWEYLNQLAEDHGLRPRDAVRLIVIQYLQRKMNHAADSNLSEPVT